MRQARAAAGDRASFISDGASTVQAILRAGLVDEFQLHLVPVLLGRGTRLFDQIASEPIGLERLRIVESPNVTHIRFRVVK